MSHSDDINLIKVKDKNYLFRDPSTEAIVNSDYEGYNKYVEQYKKKYKENKKMEQIESELNIINNELSEIKTILRKIINES